VAVIAATDGLPSVRAAKAATSEIPRYPASRSLVRRRGKPGQLLAPLANAGGRSRPRQPWRYLFE
jgi:hypothetical protein